MTTTNNSQKKYRVTREFTGGNLEGLTHIETTSVKFAVGLVVDRPAGGGSPYKIVSVEEVVSHCRCPSIRGEVRRSDGWLYCGGCGDRIGDGSPKVGTEPAK